MFYDDADFASDNASTTTRAGISGAEITLRDEAGQKARTGQTAEEAIAALNRDVSSDRDGSNAIDNLYERDKDKIDAGFEITRAFQNEVSTFVANKAKEADELKKELEKQGIVPETNAEYIEASKWAPGGQYSQIITAITAATGSNIMGGFDQLAQAAVLNYVQGMTATEIKKLADKIGKDTPEGEAARAVLQGLAACGAQAGQGGDCASAGMGTAAGVITNAVLNNLDKTPENMTSEEKKAREDLISTLIAGAAGGDVASATAGMQIEQENNLLANKYGIKNLDKKGKELYEKLKAAGIGSIDELQEKFIKCNGNGDCEKNVRNEYMRAEEAAGQKILALYQSGGISHDDYILLVTRYANAMMKGAGEGQSNSPWGGLKGDIYGASGFSWTPMGVIGNQYIQAIRQAERIAEWKEQGLSNQEIDAKMLKDGVIGSFMSPLDRNKIINMLDNGATSDEITRFAAGLALNKVIGNAAAKGTTAKGTTSSASQQQSPSSNKDTSATAARPTWRQSEIDVGADLGSTATAQVAYKNRQKVPANTKGSVRPDHSAIDGKNSYEVKNYNIETNSNSLINNVAKQAKERDKHLPKDMKQNIVIDIRGQSVSPAQRQAIVSGITRKSNGIISPSSITFKTK